MKIGNVLVPFSLVFAMSVKVRAHLENPVSGVQLLSYLHEYKDTSLH